MAGPVKHIVMWRLRAENAQERDAACRKVKDAFEGLRGRIAGLRTLEIGVDISRVDYACDVVLVSEFASAEQLEDYARHPEHLRVRDELGDLRIERRQVDYYPEQIGRAE